LLKADGTVDYAGYSSLDFFEPFGLGNEMRQFACGFGGDGDFCIFQSSDGTVGVEDLTMVPGYNSYISPIPVAAELTNVIAVAANGSAPVVLKSDGTLEGWGGYGRYGDPITPPFTNYYPGISNIIAIAGNQAAILALRNDGAVIDTTSMTATNAALPSAAAIALGYTHALALIKTNLTVTPPTFLEQPQSQNVIVGGTIFLEPGIIGFGPTTYQWYFNQTNLISGATNSYLMLTNMQPQQSGRYTLIASNSVGSATSSAAFVSVIPALAVNIVPAITITGGVGTTYELDYINQFGATNAWLPLATLTLTNNPQLYFDLSAIGQPSRFYRIVQAP
jgi:hypothetical protein